MGRLRVEYHLHVITAEYTWAGGFVACLCVRICECVFLKSSRSNSEPLRYPPGIIFPLLPVSLSSLHLGWAVQNPTPDFYLHTLVPNSHGLRIQNSVCFTFISFSRVFIHFHFHSFSVTRSVLIMSVISWFWFPVTAVHTWCHHLYWLHFTVNREKGKGSRLRNQELHIPQCFVIPNKIVIALQAMFIFVVYL